MSSSTTDRKRRPERSRDGGSRTAQDRALRKVVLDLDPAAEVVALLADEPGDANEQLLDEALAALENAGPRIPSADQQRAAVGEVVALELSKEAAEAVATLIRRDREVQPGLLRRTRQRLQGKLRSARHKRGRH